MDEQPCSSSFASSGATPTTTTSCLKETRVKARKKKVNNKSNKNTTCHNQEPPKGHKTAQPVPSTSSQQEKIQRTGQTSDRSTQTEHDPQPSAIAQSTQTQIQDEHLPVSTESKATQTIHTSFSIQQAYWGLSPGDGMKIPSSSENPNLTLISWNIDGLDTDEMNQRAKGLLSNLANYRADVVLLQELIPGYFKLLQGIMKDYLFLQASDEGYFSGILLRKDRVKFLQSNILKFPTTEMGRNLLMANVSFFGHSLCIMTSHLESCKSGSQERLNQLRRVWKWMKEAPTNCTVIFGGDTNLRDWEVARLGGLPDGISDVWERLGQPEDCRYTWDTSINDNKAIPNSVRLRFDRMFFREAAEDTKLQPVNMSLIGLEKLKCDYYISDHWGVFCSFQKETTKEDD